MKRKRPTRPTRHAVPMLTVVPPPAATMPAPAPEPTVGAVVLLTDVEAAEVLALNRVIVRASEDAKAAVAVHNARIAEAQTALSARIEALATAHGIVLDPARPWSFDVATGTFTRQPDAN